MGKGAGRRTSAWWGDVEGGAEAEVGKGGEGGDEGDVEELHFGSGFQKVW